MVPSKHKFPKLKSPPWEGRLGVRSHDTSTREFGLNALAYGRGVNHYSNGPHDSHTIPIFLSHLGIGLHWIYKGIHVDKIALKKL